MLFSWYPNNIKSFAYLIFLLLKALLIKVVDISIEVFLKLKIEKVFQ